ncbi:DUF397 domain-containing protein [Nocardiopsis sp. HUAS JQ3]|jgi:hypothetical protein|uniref:DUF397 domain-containing protein n=1 Tax=Nocardiopsis sp. HUAS JQ3 TaxID=3061629 RepID=UPI0023A96C6E|nr:DUF397 domain-containing protein [Nocardiopsis sp. HUAS JQ3]WDZ90808.1 DUF397 domain-containing protein [Nocardiopsis sp. HUAS JQ3]
MYSFPDETWRTSTYTQKDNCVEVADAPGVSAVRDTKYRDRGHLLFESPEWRRFVDCVKTDG